MELLFHLTGPTMDALIVTLLYTALLAWGIGVGLAQVWQGFVRPESLLNPLFRNRWAMWLFVLHLVVVTADLLVCGPLALAYKSTLWYWGGRIALLVCSIPLALHLNRNPQSFGALIGRWVVFRNIFEVALHVVVAVRPNDWFHYHVLLWWLVAYRYIDVGPRRLLQTLYSTPQRLARRPWAPTLNWAVITLLYVLTFLAVYRGQIAYAVPPAADTPEHVAQTWEYALVVGINAAIALACWALTRKYKQSLTA